jgi:hypothetical protein
VSPPFLVFLAVIVLAVTVFLIIIVMKTDIDRVIVLPQDPIYSFQDVVHKAIVLRDVNRWNGIVTAGLKGTFTTMRTISLKIKNLYLSTIPKCVNSIITMFIKSTAIGQINNLFHSFLINTSFSFIRAM